MGRDPGSNLGRIELTDDVVGVGNREHIMIRFVNKEPKFVWFSQHSSGQAFTFDVVQKDASGNRVSPCLPSLFPP